MNTRRAAGVVLSTAAVFACALLSGCSASNVHAEVVSSDGGVMLARNESNGGGEVRDGVYPNVEGARGAEVPIVALVTVTER